MYAAPYLIRKTRQAILTKSSRWVLIIYIHFIIQSAYKLLEDFAKPYFHKALTMEEERTLAVFERKILRKIYGPVKENELWGIRQNDELEAIIKGEKIVRFIKYQRIRWLGHVERMQEIEIPKKMLYGKLYATRRRGRPRMRWLDDVSMDLRKKGVNEWTDRARNRETWRHIVVEAKAHPGL